MKIEYFQCFQAIAKYKSFSLAAEELYISQSSLSKKIKAFEELLGGTLFIRKNNNTVQLSPFGEYISNYINNILEDYDLLITAMDNYKLNNYRTLHISAFLNVAHSGLLTPITEFEQREPTFYFETSEKDHSLLKQQLATKEVDICFGYQEFLGEWQDYDIYPLYLDSLLLVTTKDFAENQGLGDSMNLSEAKGYSFCFPREDMQLFSFFVQICRLSNFSPQLTNSDVRLGTIRQYISRGMRCTLQFESISRSKFYADQFAFIRLENTPQLTMAMYVEKTRKNNIKSRFIDFMISYYKNNSQHSITT